VSSSGVHVFVNLNSHFLDGPKRLQREIALAEYPLDEGPMLRFRAIGILPRMSDNPPNLKQYLETQYGGKATHIRSVSVHLSRKGRTVWNGAVQVFDLVGRPNGTARAYAWSQGRPDGHREIVAMLDEGLVTGPKEAVQAALQR
jgi:hypothetical protein